MIDSFSPVVIIWPDRYNTGKEIVVSEVDSRAASEPCKAVQGYGQPLKPEKEWPGREAKAYKSGALPGCLDIRPAMKLEEKPP